MKAALGMPGILPMALAFRLACVADDDCNGKGAGPPAPSGEAMQIGLGGQGRVLPTRSGGGARVCFQALPWRRCGALWALRRIRAGRPDIRGRAALSVWGNEAGKDA